MASPRVVLSNLRSLDRYLSGYHGVGRSTRFEQIVAEAFSHTVRLPFYTSATDIATTPHRVTWLGTIHSLHKAPPGGADAIARCFGFHCIIEATLTTGATQYQREFAQSIRHCEDYCTQNNVQHDDAFILFVCREISQDTYRSLRSHPQQEYRFVPIEVSDLAKILQTSILAFTMRHLELRGLFVDIHNSLRNSSTRADFRRSIMNHTKQWQKNVLSLEKSVFVGFRSYQAMQTFESRRHIGVGEILRKLQKHPIIGQYFNIIGDKISTEMIEDSSICHSFACKLASTFDGEVILEPVPGIDFRQRLQRLVHAVERIK